MNTHSELLQGFVIILYMYTYIHLHIRVCVCVCICIYTHAQNHRHACVSFLWNIFKIWYSVSGMACCAEFVIPFLQIKGHSHLN